jgi:SAM-dependent methyltransferase
VTLVAPENVEALEAWNGVLFDRFVRYRHLVVDGLAPHGEAALRSDPPCPGDRVLDIGCGFGDTTQELARLVGPAGRALGVDVAPRFIEAACGEAETAGLSNVRFDVRDVEVTQFAETFDYAFSRFGTMFFANPVAALRNVRCALAPGGRLVSVVWRRKLDNPWLNRAEDVIVPLVDVPRETDGARCGPGPFSLANADTVSGILLAAGFEDIALRRVDRPLLIGRDLDEAVEFNLALGPAAEAIRLAGHEGARLRPQLLPLLRNALAEFERQDGVVAGSSTWTIVGHAPHVAAARPSQ